jgi:precorrin-6B methylase 2
LSSRKEPARPTEGNRAPPPGVREEVQRHEKLVRAEQWPEGRAARRSGTRSCDSENAGANKWYSESMSEKSKAYGEHIDRIAAGYRDAQVLLTANRLGIFRLLEEGPKTAAELARKLEAPRRGVEILCDALVALTLLHKKEGKYENSEAARACLLPSSPASKSAMLLHNAGLYERWGKLYQVVKTGRPVADDETDPALRRREADFARAMADSARAVVKTTVDALPLEEARRMLDVGGGPGIYSIEFMRRYPQLHCVILDNPKTLEVAQENAREAGLADRLTLLPGDAFTDDLRGPYDFVLLSNLIHSYSAEANIRLVKKCAAALSSGGRLCLKDFFLEPDRTAPVWAALFAVNMLVNTEEGNCYTIDEASSWLTGCGLIVEPLGLITPQTGLLTARKP